MQSESGSGPKRARLIRDCGSRAAQLRHVRLAALIREYGSVPARVTEGREQVGYPTPRGRNPTEVAVALAAHPALELAASPVGVRRGVAKIPRGVLNGEEGFHAPAHKGGVGEPTERARHGKEREGAREHCEEKCGHAALPREARRLVVSFVRVGASGGKPEGKRPTAGNERGARQLVAGSEAKQAARGEACTAKG